MLNAVNLKVPTLRFVRMTLIAVQFVFLDNCYIISILFALWPYSITLLDL